MSLIQWKEDLKETLNPITPPRFRTNPRKSFLNQCRFSNHNTIQAEDEDRRRANHDENDRNDPRHVGSGEYWENYAQHFETRGLPLFSANPTIPWYESRGNAWSPIGNDQSIGLRCRSGERAFVRWKEFPILMGHSMGGLLAQILGSRGLAKALVLLTPGLSHRYYSTQNCRSSEASGAPWCGGVSGKSRCDRSLKKPSTRCCTCFPGWAEKAFGKFGIWGKPGGFRDRVLAFGPAKSSGSWMSQRLPSCTGHWGFRGSNHPVSVVRQVARNIIRLATYKEFAGHAHWVIGEPGWEECEVCQWVLDRLN